MIIKRTVWSAIAKNINENRILISRDCGFFMMFDSVSSLENDWNCSGVLGL